MILMSLNCSFSTVERFYSITLESKNWLHKYEFIMDLIHTGTKVYIQAKMCTYIAFV